MAAKTKTTKAAAPKAAAPAVKTRGQKIAASQRRNAEMRDTITDMTTLQLRNFVKRFKPAAIDRLKGAIAQYEETMSQERKETIAKQIEKLKAEYEQL